MPVDLTSPWIPLSLIMLLGVFMIRQFRQERREARQLALAESLTPAEAPSAAGGSPAPERVEPVATPAKAGEAPPAKKKMKLRWRTAWIWMPFLIGFFGQAYLTFVKPMMDGAS